MARDSWVDHVDMAEVVHNGTLYKLLAIGENGVYHVYLFEVDDMGSDEDYFVWEFNTEGTCDSAKQTFKLLMMDEQKILRACIDTDFA